MTYDEHLNAAVEARLTRHIEWRYVLRLSDGTLSTRTSVMAEPITYRQALMHATDAAARSGACYLLDSLRPRVR